MRKIITLAICFCFLTTKASEKISIVPEPAWLFPVKPDLTKKPSSKEISSGYYLELVDKQTNISKQTSYTHLVRHIVNETGVQNASEVSVTFAPEYQTVQFHKISVIRNGVTVSSVNLSQIKVVQEETDASDFQYNGLKRAFVIVKDVRKDDRLDFAYSVVGENPVFKNKFSTDIYFTVGVAVTNFYQTIITPKSRKINFKNFNDAPSPDILAKDNDTFYHWRNPSLKISESQPGVPGWFNNEPHISATEFTNWKEVINWGVDLFSNYTFPVNGALKNKIAFWHKEAAGDTAVFIQLATRFVQDQVRYLGLEIGSYTHKPHDPNTIFEQRFGDCKDKALLLAIILRQEGIPAFVALANTNTRAKLTDQIASPDQFNHAIVAIQQTKYYRFIDATISFQRGKSKDLYMPAYGYALVLNSLTSELEPVTPGINKTTIREKFFVKNKIDGDTYLQVETDFEGDAADNNRSFFSDYSIRELEDNYRKFYAKYYDSIQLDQEIHIQDDTVNNKIHVSENYVIPEMWHTNDKGKDFIEVFAHFLYNQLPDPSKSYKSGPLGLVYPQNIHYIMEIHLPDMWSFPFDDYHISNESYRFDYIVTRRDSVIILDYSFVTFSDHILAESMSRYKTDYKAIIALLDYSLSKYANSNTTGQSQNWSLNWISAFAALSAFVVLFFVFLKLNKSTSYTAGTGQKLGGWIVVLGASLVISLAVHLYNMYQNTILNKSVWDRVIQLGGHSLEWLLLIEQSISILVLCAILAVLYWYYKRRDIFPNMFISYVLLNIICQCLMMFSYATISYPASFGDLNVGRTEGIIRMVLYGCIWITYVVKSERVKTTFIEPYQVEMSTSELSADTITEDTPDSIENNQDIPNNE